MKFLLLRTDQINLNGRVYPKDLVTEVINGEEFQKRLKNKELLGYIGQSSDSLERNVADASHVVTDVYLEGNDLIGEIDILETPAGMSLIQSLKDGSADFGLALRGVGDMNRNEKGEQVVNSLSILSFDYVYKPSHRNK